jgi:hypothetical protein
MVHLDRSPVRNVEIRDRKCRLHQFQRLLRLKARFGRNHLLM